MKPTLTLLTALLLAPLAMLRAADVARERGRPLSGVQRWDMYSGKGYTHEQELGYAKSLYPDLWFRWQGKPLILAAPDVGVK